MTSTKFLLGDIIALGSHHFEENQVRVLYKGDPLQQSPLMTVVEILSPKQVPSAVPPKPNQYKCMWFSEKLQQFEHAWFYESMIKLILRKDDMISEKLPVGSKVVFKTLFLEISKLKSSFSAEFESTDSDKKRNMLTPLLSFISPVMLVSGYKENKSATGVNETDSQLFKLKWFNVHGDKFSEAYLPVSSLESLPVPDIGKIEAMEKAIEKGQYVKAKIGLFETFIKPVGIVYTNGFYCLRFFEVILNAMAEDMALEKISILGIVETPYLDEAPLFDLAKSDRPIKEVLKVIRDAKRNKQLIRIKYMNQYGFHSVRCLREFKIQRISNGTKKEKYVTGKCLSKMAERNFYAGRIQSVEVLDLFWDVAKIV